MPLPPDRVRPGFVVYEVLSSQEPLRTWTRDAESRKVPSGPRHVAAASITDLHQEFKIRIQELNQERRQGAALRRRRQPALRGMTYASFHDYVQKALRIGLLQVAGTEPSLAVRGQERVLAPREMVALGPLGHRTDLWGNVAKAYAARAETAPTMIERPQAAPPRQRRRAV